MHVSVRIWAAFAVVAASLMLFPGGAGVALGSPSSATTASAAPSGGLPPPDPSAIQSGTLPEFPTNLTHFVYVIRENHAFDDYLGDCFSTINSTCDYSANHVLSPNHIADVPLLHHWGQQGTVFDNMYTSEDPYSAQAHSFLFSADAVTGGGSDGCGSTTMQGMGTGTQWADYNSSSVKAGSCSWSPDSHQNWPSGGTVFDRFTRSNVAQTSNPEPFVVIGDVIWELTSPGCSVGSSGGITGSLPGNSVAVEYTTCTGSQGWWKNTSSGSVQPIPPVTNPSTHVPQMLFACQYQCNVVNPMSDQYPAYAFVSYVQDFGLPTYTWIELFDDHPGPSCPGSGVTYDQCIKWNDQSMNLIVQDIFNSTSSYKDNTVVAIAEDETQNGQNGPDSVNSGRRIPFVLVASPNVMKTGSSTPASCGITSGKCGNVVHATYNTSNVLAVMERVDLNVNHNIWSSTAGGLSTFPMALNDQLASVNPLEPVWRCGDPRVPCNTGTFGTQTLTSVSVSPSPITAGVGGTVSLSATALDQSGGTITGATFAWSSPTLGSVSPLTGSPVTYTAPGAAGGGHICVNATYNSVTVFGCDLITVTSTVTLASVSVAPGPSTSGQVSSTVNFTGTATTSVGSHVYPGGATFLWSESNTLDGLLNATSGTTDVAFNTGPQWGNVTICLNVTYSGTTLFSCSWLTISKASPTLSSATLTPATATVAPGGTQLFTSQAYDQYGHGMYGSGVTYSWSIAPTSLGSLNRSSGTGYATYSGFTAGSSPGTVTLTVQVTNGPQAVQTQTATITIASNALTATFTESISSGPAPLSVTFTGAVSGGTGTGYVDTWNFGDGSPVQVGSGATPSVTYTYTTGGSYTPSLAVVDSASNAYAFTGPAISVTGGGPQPLVAHASGTPLNGAAPLTIQLTGSATGGTAPYAYAWSFGDGSPASLQQNPSHSYPSVGTYTVTLWVNDSARVTSVAVLGVVVTSGSGTSGGLSVAALAYPLSGPAPLNVNLEATAAGGTSPYSFSWSFGDGSSSQTGVSLSHNFVNAGTYLVTVTVTDAAGKTAQGSLSVQVAPASSTPPSTSGGPLGLSWTEWGLLLVVVALVVVLAVVLATRRGGGRRRHPLEEGTAGEGYAGEAGPSYAAVPFEAAPAAAPPPPVAPPPAPVAPAAGLPHPDARPVDERAPDPFGGGRSPIARR